MNTRVVVTVTAAVLTIAAGISLAYYLPNNSRSPSAPASENTAIIQKEQPEPQALQESSTQALPQPETPGYYLRDHEGKLGVFVGNSSEPEIIFDVYIRYLPEYDRQQLAEGIYVGDYARLLSLIEDYTS